MKSVHYTTMYDNITVAVAACLKTLQFNIYIYKYILLVENVNRMVTMVKFYYIFNFITESPGTTVPQWEVFACTMCLNTVRNIVPFY